MGQVLHDIITQFGVTVKDLVSIRYRLYRTLLACTLSLLYKARILPRVIPVAYQGNLANPEKAKAESVLVVGSSLPGRSEPSV